MGTYTINTSSTSTEGNTAKLRSNGGKVVEERETDPAVRTLTFTTKTSADETFVLEIRPLEPDYVAISVQGVAATPFTETASSGGGTITGQRITFDSVTDVEFRVDAQRAPAGVAGEEASPESTTPSSSPSQDEDPADGLPVKIKVVVVHPVGAIVGAQADPHVPAPTDRSRPRAQPVAGEPR
jgi:hypothetical protein